MYYLVFHYKFIISNKIWGASYQLLHRISIFINSSSYNLEAFEFLKTWECPNNYVIMTRNTLQLILILTKSIDQVLVSPFV